MDQIQARGTFIKLIRAVAEDKDISALKVDFLTNFAGPTTAPISQKN